VFASFLGQMKHANSLELWQFVTASAIKHFAQPWLLDLRAIFASCFFAAAWAVTLPQLKTICSFNLTKKGCKHKVIVVRFILKGTTNVMRPSVVFDPPLCMDCHFYDADHN